jgi:arylsulfatase A-like enzyme
LLIKLPGNAHGGAVNQGIARHVDLAPTLAQLTGLERSERWQGESLFDDDLEPGNGLTTHGYAHLEFEGIELRAVRTEMFKLINANEGNKRNYAPVELYDLGLDPEEQKNLVGSDAESAYDEDLTRLSDVMVQMREYITEGAAEPRVSLEGMEVLEDELGAIGYLDGDSQ